jgi:hypothetical protein
MAGKRGFGGPGEKKSIGTMIREWGQKLAQALRIKR